MRKCFLRNEGYFSLGQLVRSCVIYLLTQEMGFKGIRIFRLLKQKKSEVRSSHPI